MRKAFRRLASQPNVSYAIVLKETARLILAEQQSKPVETIHDNEAKRFYYNDPHAQAFIEAFWNLVSTGLILPQPNGNQAGNFNHLMITKSDVSRQRGKILPQKTRQDI